jgi:hypothetical protein
MAEPPKKSTARPHFVGDSANFPTFKVNVQAPTKNAATSTPKAQTQAPAENPKGNK